MAARAQVVEDMLARDLAASGVDSIVSVGRRGDSRDLEGRAHAAVAMCPRFVVMDFKCALR